MLKRLHAMDRKAIAAHPGTAPTVQVSSLSRLRTTDGVLFAGPRTQRNNLGR